MQGRVGAQSTVLNQLELVTQGFFVRALQPVDVGRVREFQRGTMRIASAGGTRAARRAGGNAAH
jgi:hypothetical protein